MRLQIRARTWVKTLACTVAVVAGAALVTPTVHATERCAAADARGRIACSAGMGEAQARAMAVTQERSQWCWAASIAMIFGFHGYAVPQATIVKDVHGSVADVNAPSGEAMTGALRRPWRTPDARGFVASTQTGDIAANRYEVSNEQIVQELASGRPLLIGTRGHAMVLVEADYERRPDGDVVITGGSVIDPLPGKGLRRLTRPEMVLSYVSVVKVQALPEGEVHARADGGSVDGR
jgi:hypothetical protein